MNLPTYLCCPKEFTFANERVRCFYKVYCSGLRKEGTLIQCVSMYFSLCDDKKQLQKGKVYSRSPFEAESIWMLKAWSQEQEGEHRSCLHVGSVVRKLRRECNCSPLCLGRDPAQWIVSPMSGCIFLSLLNISLNTLTDMPRGLSSG